jgi:hypothetical protein
MKTKESKSSETPRLIGIWRRGIIKTALIDQHITREEIMALANWRVIKKEENYPVKNIPSWGEGTATASKSE